jgi:hypothetical protein
VISSWTLDVDAYLESLSRILDVNTCFQCHREFLAQALRMKPRPATISRGLNLDTCLGPDVAPRVELYYKVCVGSYGVR